MTYHEDVAAVKDSFNKMLDKMIFRTMRFQFFWDCDILLNGLDDIFADVNSIHMTYLPV